MSTNKTSEYADIPFLNSVAKLPGYVRGSLSNLLNGPKWQKGPVDLSDLKTTDPKASKGSFIHFDRKSKEIAIKDNAGNVLYKAPATSGAIGFMDPEFEGVKNKGTIPAGMYYFSPESDVYINNPANIRTFDYDLGGVSWGSGKFRLHPAEGTDTKGRSNFTIHGGGSPGSAGCIKITNLSDKDRAILDKFTELRKSNEYNAKSALQEFGYKFRKNREFNKQSPEVKDKPFKDFFKEVIKHFDGKKPIPVKVTKIDPTIGNANSLKLANFKKFAVSLPEYSATPSNESIAVQGNIDLTTRPIVKNKDGSISTVRSMSFFEPESGLEVLVPTVSDEGKIMSDEDAKSYYYKTKKHLGKFRSPEDATAYAKKLHEQQEKLYVNR